MVTKLEGISIAAILLVIASFFQVGDTSKEPTHYCESRELKAYCYDLSSTGKTCYTQEEKTGGKRCTEGWKEIPKEEETPQFKYIPSSAGKVHCTSKGCF